MIRTCPNCAAKITYDPCLGALSCLKCGGIYDIDELPPMEGEDEELPMDADRIIIDGDIAKVIHRQMMDINIYTCATCGADISITDTESSTVCAYCGNPNIVFSRVKSVYRPEGIIPFGIHKELAINIVRERLRKEKFIPKEFRKFNPDDIRGIYIPYYVHQIIYRNTIVVNVTEDHGKYQTTERIVKSGECLFDRLTTDASYHFNDDVSYKIEPFNLEAMVPYEDDYLLGFYSDIADVSEDDAYRLACEKAHDTILRDINKEYKVNFRTRVKLETSNPDFFKKASPMLVMLPVWFLPIKYKGENYMIVMNGQTGELDYSAPSDKKKVVAATTLASLGLTTLCVLLSILLYRTGQIVFYDYMLVASIIWVVIGTIRFFKYKRLAKLADMRSKSSTVHKFVSRRQEGN